MFTEYTNNFKRNGSTFSVRELRFFGILIYKSTTEY